MTTFHRLSGYSKITELLETEVPVPAAWLGHVMDVAGVSRATDPDAIGSYRIADADLGKLTELLSAIGSTETYDWFLEAFAEEPVEV